MRVSMPPEGAERAPAGTRSTGACPASAPTADGRRRGRRFDQGSRPDRGPIGLLSGIVYTPSGVLIRLRSAEAAVDRKRITWSGLICRALAVMAAAGPSVVRGREPGVELQPLTFSQVMDAGAAGSGCSWSPGKGRAMLFAAADDRAVVRIRGRVIVLAPMPGARDLFPTTFADWSHEGITIRVRQRGATRVRNAERLTYGAVLTLTDGRVSERFVGTMSCGS